MSDSCAMAHLAGALLGVARLLFVLKRLQWGCSARKRLGREKQWRSMHPAASLHAGSNLHMGPSIKPSCTCGQASRMRCRALSRPLLTKPAGGSVR
jgi:hypothetical protein